MPKSGVSFRQSPPSWTTVTPSVPVGTIAVPSPSSSSPASLRSRVLDSSRASRAVSRARAPAPTLGRAPVRSSEEVTLYRYRVAGTNMIRRTTAPLPRIFSPAAIWDTGASSAQCRELRWDVRSQGYVFPDGSLLPHGPPLACADDVERLLFDGVERGTVGHVGQGRAAPDGGGRVSGYLSGYHVPTSFGRSLARLDHLARGGAVAGCRACHPTAPGAVRYRSVSGRDGGPVSTGPALAYTAPLPTIHTPELFFKRGGSVERCRELRWDAARRRYVPTGRCGPAPFGHSPLVHVGGCGGGC